MSKTRKCTVIKSSSDGRTAIAVDVENAETIFEYLKRDKRHEKKFTFIASTILTNRATKDLFRQEKINANTGHVYAMRFFPGQENDRIYCQKIERNGVTYVILCNLLERKKSTKLKHRENTLINQIARYEYEIE